MTMVLVHDHQDAAITGTIVQTNSMNKVTSQRMTNTLSNSHYLTLILSHSLLKLHPPYLQKHELHQ